MEKVEIKFNSSISSPRSPFQFGMMKGLYRNSSYSTSSCSFDTEGEEEESAITNGNSFVVSKNYHGYPVIAPPSPSILYASLDELKSAQTNLRSAMARAHELQVAVGQSHGRVRSVVDRVSLLNIAVSPLAFQSSKVKQIEDHMDKATRPAKTALHVFNSLQKLHGVLSAGPLEDVGHYVEALSHFQQYMKFMHKCGPMVIDALGQGIAFLKSSKMVDRFHMEQLCEVAETLQALFAGQEYFIMSRRVVDEALENLIAAFERIIRDYGNPMDLSQCLIEHSEGDQKIQSKQVLPAPVLQILQEIAERLTLNDKLEICLEIYETERGYKLKESLQTLQANSYLCYQTPDAINLMEWTSLEEHLAKWAQHMDVLVNVSLASEHSFCQQVFSQVRPDAAIMWKEGFARMAMEAGLASFFKFGEAVTKSHREPQKLFKLLDMFECLEKLQPKLSEIFSGGGLGCRDIQKKMRSLQKKVVEGVIRILKELKYHVEVQEEGSNNNLSNKNNVMSKGGAVLKLVSYIVNYLKYMLSEFYKPLISSALKAEQSMIKKSFIKKRTDTLAVNAGDNHDDDGDDDDKQQQQLLQMAVLEIMQALDKKVATSAEMLLGVPAYASFFLLNNYSYIHTRCGGSEVGALLGEGWLQRQLDKVELCAMQYKQEAWGQIIMHVNCEGLSSSFNSIVSSGSSAGRELIRKRAKAFHASLDSVIARHSTWSIGNEDLRKRISHDVLQSVVPAYQSFLQKYSHFLEPMSTTHQHLTPDGATHHNQLDNKIIKYNPQAPNSSNHFDGLDNTIIKYTPETVEHMLTSLFEPPFRHHHLHHGAKKKNHTPTNKNTNAHFMSAFMSDYDSSSLSSNGGQFDHNNTSSKRFQSTISQNR